MILRNVDQTVEEAMRMLSKAEPNDRILFHLVKAAESIQGDVVSSILVLDDEGLLRNAASPGLPYDYLAAIDGLKPDPGVGTCAAVAATGNMVVTMSFLDDRKWAELKHLPMALGFVGAWSFPIKNTGGKVLGTFGTYYRTLRKPSSEEVEAVSKLADTAAHVLLAKQP